MDEYLSLSEAAKIVHLPETYLYELAKNGTINSAMFSGTVLVSKKDAQALTPIYTREGYDTSLADQKIGIVEASKKYNIPHPTISRWVKASRIRVLGIEGRKKLISEGDIVYYAKIYHEQGGGQGRWVFDQAGNVYTKKSS